MAGQQAPAFVSESVGIHHRGGTRNRKVVIGNQGILVWRCLGKHLEAG